MSLVQANVKFPLSLWKKGWTSKLCKYCVFVVVVVVGEGGGKGGLQFDQLHLIPENILIVSQEIYLWSHTSDISSRG